MKLEVFLKIAQGIETERLGWYERHGDDGCIRFRIADYSGLASAKAFHHAQEAEAELCKAKIRSYTDMDRQSYTVLMKVPGIYKQEKRGAK